MKGRFAPSPTGYIHLGNVWIALLSYISTRQQKRKICCTDGGYRPATVKTRIR